MYPCFALPIQGTSRNALENYIPFEDLAAPNMVLFGWSLIVATNKCQELMANPMTDKIGAAGSPTGEGCTDPFGSCFSVYYSCTKSFRISGSVPRSE